MPFGFLLELLYNSHTLKEVSYEFAYKHPFYTNWKEFNESDGCTIKYVRGGHMIVPKQYERINVDRGIVRLTQFGFNFISACVIDAELVKE